MQAHEGSDGAEGRRGEQKRRAGRRERGAGRRRREGRHEMQHCTEGPCEGKQGRVQSTKRRGAGAGRQIDAARRAAQRATRRKAHAFRDKPGWGGLAGGCLGAGVGGLLSRQVSMGVVCGSRRANAREQAIRARSVRKVPVLRAAAGGLCACLARRVGLQRRHLRRRLPPQKKSSSSDQSASSSPPSSSGSSNSVRST